MKNIIPTAQEVAEKIRIEFGKKSPDIITTDDIFIKLHGNWYIIPKGFRSDGASLPWIMTFLVDRKNENIILFSILHDYFYRTQFVPRFYADAIYENGLKETAGLSVSRTFYLGLRIAGGVAWRNNQKKGLQKYPDAYQRMINHVCEVEKKELK